jgi:hypothetical protein
MQPQGAPMLGYCCVLCHRFMQTLANSTVAGIPQWPVLPRSPLQGLKWFTKIASHRCDAKFKLHRTCLVLHRILIFVR